MKPLNIDEARADTRLVSLEIGGPTTGASQYRAGRRSDYEAVASDYLSLHRSGKASPIASLKILHALDLVRARDIALQQFRFARIGKFSRGNWSPRPIGQHREDSTSNTSTDYRMLRQTQNIVPLFTRWQRQSNGPEGEWGNDRGLRQLDTTRTIFLHLGFVQDDLVIALDDNVGCFYYGQPFVDSDRKVRGETFRDYGYMLIDNSTVRPDPQGLVPARVFFGPESIEGVRHKLDEIARKLLEDCSIPDGPADGAVMECLRSMDECLQSERIVAAISNWATQRGSKISDVCLVILPDEMLFHLPLGFLGMSSNTPLMTHLGGVTIGLSMIALKWRLASYHWGTLSNCSVDAPRCTFFGADSNPIWQPLKESLISEAESVCDAFGPNHSRIFAHNATTLDFARDYCAGDIAWFAGHGVFQQYTSLETEQGSFAMPLTGPLFMDGPLTNFDLLATSDWNFQPLWLAVMNACVLGKSLLAGGNPLGFVSSLYSAGCASVVAPLWTVFDAAATRVAKNLATELVDNYAAQDFPRARSLSNAIRKSISEDGNNVAKYVPYTLWGLP
jgi:hypothetical protein